MELFSLRHKSFVRCADDNVEAIMTLRKRYFSSCMVNAKNLKLVVFYLLFTTRNTFCFIGFGVKPNENVTETFTNLFNKRYDSYFIFMNEKLLLYFMVQEKKKKNRNIESDERPLSDTNIHKYFNFFAISTSNRKK